MIKYRNQVIYSLLLLLLISYCTKEEVFVRPKYIPDENKVLVFVGQDNESVGGNDRFQNGYVNNVGLPAGITHYIGFRMDSTGRGYIQGLDKETTWGAGPMNLKYYLDSPKLKNTAIHLSIDYVGHDSLLAIGELDSIVVAMGQFIKSYNDRPFYIRIGYEFDGSWNNYDSIYFKQSFKRVVDILEREKVNNFTTVMASSSFLVDSTLWENYYPGNDYVDWCGYSYWGGNPLSDTCSTIQFALAHNKPLFIAEIAPRGHFLDDENGEELWKSWFEVFFQHIKDNIKHVKAISYINCDWDNQPMWKGQNWGDTRIEANTYIHEQWLKKMNNPIFINGNANVFKEIGFN